MSSFSAYTFQRGKGQLASAWINFDGRGGGSLKSIRDSFNINSVTDLGKGVYRITFAVAMSNNSYSVQGCCSQHVGADGVSVVSDVATVTVKSVTTTYFEISTASVTASSVAKFDPEFVTLAIFGD